MFKAAGDVVVYSGVRERNWVAVNTEKLSMVVKGTPPWIDLRLEQAFRAACRSI